MIRRRRLVRGGGDAAPVRVRYAEPPLWSGAVSLKATLHGGHIWTLPADLRFTECVRMLPLALSEALHAAAYLPLALTSDQVPRPMILLAAQAGTASPLIAAGRLAGRYFPAILRFYPFLPYRDPQERHLVVAGDMESAHLLEGQSGGKWMRVFDETGQFAPDAAQRVQAMTQWQAGRDAALVAARALSQAGVLCPARGLAEGWQTVDPAKLAALSPDLAATLHRNGGLALAHALITGAAHWPRLFAAQASHVAADTAGQDFLQAFGRAQAADGFDLPVGAARS